MNITTLLINFAYIISAGLFIFGLKMLSSPATARRGNMLSALGMLLAIVVTLFYSGLDYKWIVVGVVIGTVIGLVAAYKVQMTSMPEMVALFNGFGGIASLLLAWSEYHQHPELSVFIALVTVLTAFVGGITFSGSMVAFGKLAEIMPSKAIVFSGQHIVNGAILLAALASGVMFAINPETSYAIFMVIVVVALLFGVTSVIPIGGADMPVVISLLNSYSGLAACAAGFVISNNILIVAGALVGASGIILTNIMCKAMNRSLANVLFSGFGSVVQATGSGEQQGEVRPATAEDVYYILEAADSVAIVPGFGLGVELDQLVTRYLVEFL
jgi:NAD(P) transhydrogenase subunit beta